MNFVSEGQGVVFVGCFLIGVYSMLFYGLFSAVRYIAKNKIIGFLCDLGYFLLLFLIYKSCLERWRFPSIMPYMPIGVLLGGIISCTLLRNTLAKPFILLYNLIVNNIIIPLRVCLNGKRKDKKVSKRFSCNCGVPSCNSPCNSCVSNGLFKSGKKRIGRIERG